jgi:hypothetical protein
MWLALSSIVLASAIGFNALALWLSGCFERKQPEGWNTNPGERCQRSAEISSPVPNATYAFGIAEVSWVLIDPITIAKPCTSACNSLA